jgi:hypothetical protein
VILQNEKESTAVEGSFLTKYITAMIGSDCMCVTDEYFIRIKERGNNGKASGL